MLLGDGDAHDGRNWPPSWCEERCQILFLALRIENMRTPGHIRENEHEIPGTRLLIPGSCGNRILNNRRNDYI